MTFQLIGPIGMFEPKKYQVGSSIRENSITSQPIYLCVPVSSLLTIAQQDGRLVLPHPINQELELVVLVLEMEASEGVRRAFCLSLGRSSSDLLSASTKQVFQGSSKGWRKELTGRCGRE
jgi:hypothetical protein